MTAVMLYNWFAQKKAAEMFTALTVNFNTVES